MQLAVLHCPEVQHLGGYVRHQHTRVKCVHYHLFDQCVCVWRGGGERGTQHNQQSRVQEKVASAGSATTC